ncbi:MAG TPA: nucleotide pyrophosphohydrolase [Candidatus Caldiarchaeum subterraneum]|uniref:Nucleotide pyrophosphohydrolase n=1 Tax=Caldiarchaeum subterraneum TaxID=311458 RepID=A0A833A4S5_CALS0|nr:nucleotide pyrophosphohydrolase [Aigarchaeota archaeon]HIQ30033.1 nucleotide pyrophosphohydrolase [Candidatus Caldarchaeum subterraneum]
MEGEAGLGSASLRGLQVYFRKVYFSRDSARGAERTFLWFVSEVGEAADALKDGDEHKLRAELADVIAWLLSFCNVVGIDLQDAVVEKYGSGCPRCGSIPCSCD